MKYKEAAALIEELQEKESDRIPEGFYRLIGYKKGMEDIIRVLCDKGVIDNSEELKREREGGY